MTLLAYKHHQASIFSSRVRGTLLGQHAAVPAACWQLVRRITRYRVQILVRLAELQYKTESNCFPSLARVQTITSQVPSEKVFCR